MDLLLQRGRACTHRAIDLTRCPRTHAGTAATPKYSRKHKPAGRTLPQCRRPKLRRWSIRQPPKVAEALRHRAAVDELLLAALHKELKNVTALRVIPAQVSAIQYLPGLL